MGREIIQNSIIDTLESILSIVSNINTSEGVIPQIDIDLLQERIRKLYQEVHYLDEENQKWKDDAIPKIKEVKKAETTVISKEIQKEATEENKTIKTSKANDVDILTTDILEEKIPKEEIPKEELVSKEKIKGDKIIQEKTIEPKLFNDNISVAEKLNVGEKSINDQISEKSEDDELNNKMNLSPISNLKTAIGINDKFMFVNELFNGDMKSYDLFIYKINDMEVAREAIEIYHSKLRDFDTNIESAAAIKLEEYIQRKFIKK